MIYCEYIVKEIALLMKLKYCLNCWSMVHGKSRLVFLAKLGWPVDIVIAKKVSILLFMHPFSLQI